MSDLPPAVTESHIWAITLASHTPDDSAEARERLRSAFVSFRSKAELLAGEIRRDLPQLTLHDMTHIDALWDIASTIIGDAYPLTPAEGFVLGGAFLLHDLGMALPAVDGGIAALRADPRWTDLVTYEYQTSLGRDPSPAEVLDPDEDIHNRVLMSILQQIHAENAERLVFKCFSLGKAKDSLYLIDDPEIRQTFGRVIGQVAHSHWWTLSNLEKQFQRTMGAASWCPRNWTVDPLHIACVLRCADAAQIDARRAPIFLNSLSDLPSTSIEHWTFQEKLNKPYLEEDALVFTTGNAFSKSEASAWWLCLDALRMVDKELGSVDAVFADKGSPRFAAKRVAGVEEPERLVAYLHTDGWLPINATIHVTDLPRVIKSVGGEELYGKHPTIAVRELIQNACDAVCARRVYERRPPDYGAVHVSLTKSADDSYWLEVRDNGVGMSRLVLTDFLLDFGRPFWGSPEMQRDFPGLLSSGIKQIGKYGIGFFSVFMLADNVQVITRRSDAAAMDTLVLEFSRGLTGRPILREAEAIERLIDGGTRVRLRLQADPFSADGLLHNHHGDAPRSLADICMEQCPALEVDLNVEEGGIARQLVKGGDWRTLDAFTFLKRMPIEDEQLGSSSKRVDDWRRKAAENVRFLRNSGGDIVGRALITTGYADFSRQGPDLSGVVTSGGLKACSLTGIAGILVGVPTKASRDSARPIVADEELRRWAEEQSGLVFSLWSSPRSQAACAQYIRLCGGNTGDLPICRNKGRWYSARDICSRTDLPDQVVLLDDFAVDHLFEHIHSYTLNDNVFVVRSHGIPGLLQCRVSWPRDISTNFTEGSSGLGQTLGGAVLESVAYAWGTDVHAILESINLESESDVTVGFTDTGDLKERALVVSRPSR